MTAVHRPPPGGWRVPFVKPDLPALVDLAEGIESAVGSGVLTKGDQLRRLEAEAVALLGVKHVVGVSSCTVGLALVLKSLATVRGRAAAGCTGRGSCPLPSGAGLTGGSRPTGGGSEPDEVILPSFIFLAAPAAITWAGLRPVFVEVDPHTFTIDPAAVEKALTPRTAAIMACHTFGCPCDMPALEAISRRSGVPLLVDAAHGLGSLDRGRQVGAGGLAQVFSMSPTKLVVAGEGGLVATSCDCLAELVRAGREYGNDGQYGCSLPGLNGRLPELSAVVARASLARLDLVAERRRAAADAYAESLAGLPGVVPQSIPSTSRSSWKDFVIAIDPASGGLDRDALRDQLAARGIETRAYFSPACHQMEAFAGCLPPGRRIPVTERLAATLVALPMGAHVTPDVARDVSREIRAAVGAVACAPTAAAAH